MTLPRLFRRLPPPLFVKMAGTRAAAAMLPMGSVLLSSWRLWPVPASCRQHKPSPSSIPANFQQNLLSAVRSLEQINNQISQLQNEAQTLSRLDQNLQRLGTTLSPDLQRAMTEIEAGLAKGEGLALKLKETEAAYAKLFPQELTAGLSNDRGASERPRPAGMKPITASNARRSSRARLPKTSASTGNCWSRRSPAPAMPPALSM